MTVVEISLSSGVRSLRSNEHFPRRVCFIFLAGFSHVLETWKSWGKPANSFLILEFFRQNENIWLKPFVLWLCILVFKPYRFGNKHKHLIFMERNFSLGLKTQIWIQCFILNEFDLAKDNPLIWACTLENSWKSPGISSVTHAGTCPNYLCLHA